MADEIEHPALLELRRRLEDEEASYTEALAALDRLAAFPAAGGDGARGPRPPRGAERPLAGGAAARRGRPRRGARPPRLRRARARDRPPGAVQRRPRPSPERPPRARGAAPRAPARDVRGPGPLRAAGRARDRRPRRHARGPDPDRGRAGPRGLRPPSRRRCRAASRGSSRCATASRSSRRRCARCGRASCAQAPPPQVARSATRAAADSTYTAFENRFRGSREDVRARQADYVELLRGQGPVVDLGCGRGELLDLLRAAGIEARGVEGNAHAVRECRGKGLDVVEGDLVEFLRGQAASRLGAVFAAQVAEHLPPPVLAALLAESHRVLRPGGLLVLETVNPASALGFLDVFIRDLTHERPLHPETLRFLAAAAGFSEARIEMRSPVPDDVRLRLLARRGPAPAGGQGPERERRAAERAALRPGRLRARRTSVSARATHPRRRRRAKAPRRAFRKPSTPCAPGPRRSPRSGKRRRAARARPRRGEPA